MPLEAPVDFADPEAPGPEFDSKTILRIHTETSPPAEEAPVCLLFYPFVTK